MAPSSTSSSAPAGQQAHAPNTNTTNSSTEPEKTAEYASIIPSPRNNENDQDHLQLQRTVSSISHHDMANVQYIATGDNDVIYSKFTPRRKMVIVAVVSFCSFLAPISSTTVLSAVPEVADTFHTDGSIINVSNALYMLFMGLSPCFYGPYGNIYGRKWVSVVSAALFTAFSVGTALAPNLAAFFVFRILTAFQGTAFLVIGSAVIGDIYKPVCILFPAVSGSFRSIWRAVYEMSSYHTPLFKVRPPPSCTSLTHPDGTRNSTRLVPLRDTHRPRTRPLHRRHHRHIPLLAGHILASNRARGCRNGLLLLPAARDDPRETRRRTRRSAAQATRAQNVAVAQPLPRR
jgi:hypothetical protein